MIVLEIVFGVIAVILVNSIDDQLREMVRLRRLQANVEGWE